MKRRKRDDAAEFSGGCTAALVLVFVVGLLFFRAGCRERSRLSNAEDWRTVDAKVVRTSVSELDNPNYVTYRDETGRTRTVDDSEPRTIFVIGLDYGFTVDGAAYSGSDVWDSTYRRRIQAEQAPKPQTVRVYYDPQSPDRNSMSDPVELRSSALLPLIVGPLLMAPPAALAILWLWLRFRGPRRRAEG